MVLRRVSCAFPDQGRRVRFDKWNGFVQIGQFDDLSHRRLRICQRESALVGQQLAVRDHQQSQSRAVEERYLGQVNDDVLHILSAEGLEGILEGLALGIGKVSL